MKGKQFTPADLPRKHKLRPEQAKAWADGMTERYRVVAIDPDAPEGKQEIIAEELQARALDQLSPKAKRVAGALLRMPADARAEALAAFDRKGTLKIPFKAP